MVLNRHLFINCLILFLGFLTVGIPLPVLPSHVHDTLLFGNTVVGLVIGIQSVATLITRGYAGWLSDTRGARTAVLLGLAMCSIAGVVYFLSLLVTSQPTVSLAVLLLGRIVLGVGEGALLTGMLAWGVALAGVQNTGRVIGYLGIAMWGALAFGAPLGDVLHQGGFARVAIVITLLALVALGICLTQPPVPTTAGARVPFYKVIGFVLQSGLGLAFANIGYAAIATFGTLYFKSHGWAGSALALTSLGVSYIVARAFFSGLPDKLGGSKVALGALAIELAGQTLLAFAQNPVTAFVGAALTGFGFSLVFPSLGVLAMKNVPPPSRGAALGAYSAFFDVALALSGPLTGTVATYFGYDSVFVCGIVGAVLAIIISTKPQSNQHMRNELH